MLFSIGMSYTSYAAQAPCVTALEHTVKVNLLVCRYTESPSILLWPKKTNMNLVARISFHSYDFMQSQCDLASVQATVSRACVCEASCATVWCGQCVKMLPKMLKIASL